MPDLSPADERALAVQIAQAQLGRVQALIAAIEADADTLVAAVASALDGMGLTPGVEQQAVSRANSLLQTIAAVRAGLTADERDLRYFIEPPSPDQI